MAVFESGGGERAAGRQRRGGLAADDVFVFVGAGASVSYPACLPMFDRIRDAALSAAGLEQYITAGRGNETPVSSAAVTVTEGLSPEPFFLALQRSGVDVEGWLRAVLHSTTPNVVHELLGSLAARGARVWTVNFDESVERSGSLDVCSWPDPPRPGAQLLKPHGTLSGHLIVTAAQVLAGLEPEWAEQLRRDVEGRVALFIGYSARDLDFRPLWPTVLAEATRVVWFDFPDADRQARLARRLSGVEVEFEPAESSSRNPSAAFVDWCRAAGLYSATMAAAQALSQPCAEPSFPPLGGTPALVRGGLLEILGDMPGARRAYLMALAQGRQPRAAASKLANLALSHGGRPVAAALMAARLLPPLGVAGRVRRRARRKQVSILFNVGRHRAVLRATSNLDQREPSTLAIVRAGSLRLTGPLPEAVSAAEAALDRAVAEKHNVRAANAALQLAISLLWAGRLDDAHEHIEERQGPISARATSRWVAWTDWTASCLAILSPDKFPTPFERLSLAQARFIAEGLIDGVVSALTVRLTAARQAGDPDEFVRTRRILAGYLEQSAGRYYARGHAFTREAVAFEDAEWHRGVGQLVDAAALYEHSARSSYPIHRALGLLGRAAVLSGDERRAAAAAALAAAESIGAEPAAAYARLLAASANGPFPPILLP